MMNSSILKLIATTWLISATQFCIAQSTEDVSKRTAYSSTHVYEDGRVRVRYSSQPINYKNSAGLLQPISTDFETTENGWQALEQPHPVAVSSSGVITTAFGTVQANQYRTSTWFNGQPILVQSFTKQKKNFPFRTFNLSQNGNSNEAMTPPDVLTGTTNFEDILLHIQSIENGVKYQYELLEMPAMQGTWLEVQEEMKLNNATLQPDEKHGRWKNGMWYGNLLVMAADGSINGFVQGTNVFDANYKNTVAGYKWTDKGNGRYILSTYISTAWLQDVSTAYPVMIDPLIVGPMADYGPYFMPSCFIPEYNADSILVTIPGELTVTAFYITAHFFADPFAFMVMGDGAMHFSTPCATTGNYEVAGAPGDTAGTAYLYMEDLRNPLTCCYPQSCSEQTFWLTMHLGRYTPAGGCDTLSIYYSPVTLWPFQAYIEGHTVESFASEFTVQNAAICSNTCVFDATIRARYGVPPYTFTHSWTSETFVAGEPEGCDFGNVVQHMDLNVPGCPMYCPGFDELVVPPATITDACGNNVDNLPVDILNLLEAPDVMTPPQPFYICSGVAENVLLSSCAADAVITWNVNGTGGEAPLNIQVENTTEEPFNFDYTLQATANGCTSEPFPFEVIVIPNPVAEFATSPVPAIVSNPVLFADQSTNAVGDIQSWLWNIEGYVSDEQDVIIIFDTAAYYYTCLHVTNEYGCTDELCKDILVTSNTVVAPNVFTPNSDGKNDMLEFWYLDFFPDNHLKIWNRWGNLIYEQESYRNNWTGDGHADGTYYYLLHVSNGQVLEGYFQILGSKE
ncbi:MAG: gliding motility-associated C-terminal domain-containing protein [Flavobacteriales bacterium]